MPKVLLSLLLLVFARCGPDWGVVEGTVRDGAGRALAGVEVVLFDPQVEELSPRAGLSRAVTTSEGRFQLRAAPSGDALLKIIGKQGAGRIRVQNLKGSSALEISYPVVETVVFLHDNDTHFNLNHRGLFEAYIEETRNHYPDVLLLSAGDIFIRHADRWPVNSREYYRERSRFMIESMNRLGYAAATAGNHELDYIDDITRESLELAEFPWLGANIEVATEKLPPLLPYIVLQTSTRRSIAVVGLSVVNFRKQGVQGRDPVETTRKYLHLAPKHDIFILLTHIGISADRRVAEEIGELDVIIGGHSHTLLLQSERVNSVLIAQAGGVPGGHPVDEALPKFLGKVTLTLENGKIVDKQGTVNVFLGQAPAESEEEALERPAAVN